MKIKCKINGKEKSLDINPLERVLDVLREELNLCGTKEGCGKGECGACTIILNGKTVNSCLVPAIQMQDSRIYTIEDIREFSFFRKITRAFEDAGAVQCGFCIPGFVMSTIGFLLNIKNHENVSEEDIKLALSGNLCRCTGYKKIIDAVRILVKNKIKIPIKITSKTQVQSNSNHLSASTKGNFRDKSGIHPQWNFRAPKNLDQLHQSIIKNKDKKITFLTGGTDLMVHSVKSFQENSPILFNGIHPVKSLHEIEDLFNRVNNENLPERDYVINLSQIPKLQKIQSSNNSILIGAAVSISEIISSPLIRKHFPILIKALETIGSPQIRNRATLGGNLANASPAGDSIPPLMVLDAKILICNSVEKRIDKIPLEKFFIGPGKTVLKNGEFIQQIEIPFPKYQNVIHYFRKVGQRNSLAISKTSLAGLCAYKNNKMILIKLACGSVAPTVLRLQETEEFLSGQKLNSRIIQKAKEILTTEISPIADIRSTADYRSEITANLLEDMLVKMT